MTTESQPPNHLINQSVVRFSSGSMTSHSYSNVVDTPVVGPVITILKKSNTSEASLGQVITYRLTISNKGNLDARVTLYDHMTEGTAFVPNSVIVAGVPLPLANPDRGIPLGTLHIGETLEVVFQVIILEPNEHHVLKNQAVAKYTFLTPSGREVAGQSRSNTVIIPFKRLQIIIHKSADKKDSFQGDMITYFFMITNEESQPIEHIFFKDHLSSGMVFMPGSLKIDDMSYPSANPLQGIALGDLAAHTTLTLQFQAYVGMPPASGTILNNGEITYKDGDYRTKLTSNTVTICVFDPVIHVAESVLETSATLGDTLTYTVTITNNGNIAAEVNLADFIPLHTTYVLGSLTVNGRIYSQSLLPSPVPLGTLLSGKSFVVMFQVTVNTFGIPITQTELISHAIVSYSYRLPDSRGVSNRLVSNEVRVALQQPLVDVRLAVDPLVAEPGFILHYRIEVANAGNLTASDMKLWNWIAALNTLVPGTLRINGDAASAPNPSQPLSLGDVPPQGAISVTYEAAIVLHPHASRNVMQTDARFVYQVNKPVHAGHALSNSVTVRIDHADE